MKPASPSTRARRLFVYGTLMRGERAHPLLAGAPLVGEAATEPAFDLVDLGDFPALVAGGATSVRGELYRVSPAQLAALDDYEGHPGFYRRTPIRLIGGGRAHAYVLGRERSGAHPRIASGDWRARASSADRR